MQDLQRPSDCCCTRASAGEGSHAMLVGSLASNTGRISVCVLGGTISIGNVPGKLVPAHLSEVRLRPGKLTEVNRSNLLPMSNLFLPKCVTYYT
jgi:hypothetical protein